MASHSDGIAHVEDLMEDLHIFTVLLHLLRKGTLKAWALCNCCNNSYKNELAGDMDEAFGSYVDSLYSEALPQTEHIKALREAIAAEGLPPSTHNRDTILKFDWFMAVGECLVLLLVDKVFGLDRLESEFSINVYVVVTAICLLSRSIAL